MTSADPSKKRRVLVVEDEAMITFMIEDALDRLGHEIVGPVSKLDAAMALAREAHFDAAILDVTIRGGQIFPVAELLSAKRIPFAISSGYADWSLPDSLKNALRLTKPFSETELDTVLMRLCDHVAEVENAS
jgi:DNA-binding NtrC family response regulator